MFNKFYIFIGVVIIGLFFVELVNSKKIGGKKSRYRYERKKFFMTSAEHEFFNVLTKIVGEHYYIFPQAHLPSILDHKIPGQYYSAAFSHINQKSVDYVLCDKEYLSPKLVIELDDKTHEREDRKVRDVEVEQMLKEAGLPLLRIDNHGTFNEEELRSRIKENISI